MSRSAYQKSQIFLLEFIIAVLFFALCAAICVSVFIKADHVSVSSRTHHMAVTAMQSAAECIKTVEIGMEESGDKDPVQLATEALEDYMGAEVMTADGSNTTDGSNVMDGSSTMNRANTMDEADCAIYYDEKFERTKEASAVHVMRIGLHFEDGMLAAKIQTDDWTPLVVKKYIAIEE